MGIYVNPGNESFQVALRSKIYVDKTGLLEYTNGVIGTEQRCMCVSRARRFGKSMAAGMLVAYYDKSCDSKELFSGLKIAQLPGYEQHLNKYDVINLDIAYFRVQMDTPIDTVMYMQECVIKELRESYPGMIDETEHSLPFALSSLNKKTGAEFIIVIDEWDVLFREDRYDMKAQEAYINLLRELFTGEPAEKSVKLAYITGILPIKRYNSAPALNNFGEFTMTSPKQLAEYIGFTEDEVRKLCEEYHMDFAEAQKWYDGYSFRDVKHLYNSYSVVNAMLDGEYDNYWASTVAYGSLKEYMSMDFEGLTGAVVQMLAGGRCKVDTDTFENDMTSFKNADDVLTLLIHLGYLAYDSEKKEAYIPNEEVRGVFGCAIRGMERYSCVSEKREN